MQVEKQTMYSVCSAVLIHWEERELLSPTGVNVRSVEVGIKIT